jgi:hypothetical protein
MKTLPILIALFLLAGTVQAAPAWEAQGFAHRPVADNGSDRRGKSLDQAVRDVKRQTGGRILSAETQGNEHRIKVLTPDNRVRIVRVPAGK